MPSSKINKILFEISQLGFKKQKIQTIARTHKKIELKLLIEIM